MLDYGPSSIHIHSRLAYLQKQFNIARDLDAMANIHRLVVDSEGQARLAIDVQATSTVVAAAAPSQTTTVLATEVITSTAPASTITVSTSDASASQTSISSASDLADNTASTSSLPTSQPSSTTSAFASSRSSDLHTPPFYAVVVLVCIVVCACLAALVAWYLRLRHHRRKSLVLPPWAEKRYSFTASSPRSREKAAGDSLKDLGLIVDEEIGIWEPRGDRDVGEPKRTQSYNRLPRAATTLPFPGMAQPYTFAHSRDDALMDSTAFPLPLPSAHASPFTPSSHNGTLEEDRLPTSANTLGPLKITNYMPGERSQTSFLTSSASIGLGISNVGTNMAGIGTRNGAVDKVGLGPGLREDDFGTPRERIGNMRPRYLNVNSGGSDPQMHRLPTPRKDGDGWFKNTLVNTFSPLFGFNVQNVENRLTPAPTRHVAPTRSLDVEVEEVGYVEYVGGDLVGRAPSLPKKARTRTKKGDRPREFEVGKMHRPVLSNRVSSAYSTSSASTEYSSRSTVAKSCNDSLYSYYGYPRGRPRAPRSGSSSASTATASTVVSTASSKKSTMSRTSTASTNKTSLTRRSRIPRSKHGLIAKKVSTRDPVRSGRAVHSG